MHHFVWQPCKLPRERLKARLATEERQRHMTMASLSPSSLPSHATPPAELRATLTQLKWKGSAEGRGAEDGAEARQIMARAARPGGAAGQSGAGDARPSLLARVLHVVDTGLGLGWPGRGPRWGVTHIPATQWGLPRHASATSESRGLGEGWGRGGVGAR